MKLAAVVILLALVAGALVTVSGNALAQVGDPVPPPVGDPPPPEEPPPQQPPPEDQPPPPPPPQYPPLPADSGTGRRIVYSMSEMRMWLVEENGEPSASWRVTGRAGWPRPGTYKVYSKSRWSRIRNLRWEYMTRFAKGRRLAIGMHAIPFTRRGPIQTEASLGTGTSGGCVRMARANAELVWNWAPIGTPVIVKG